MYFVLLDSTGNLLASYRDEAEACAALDQIVADDPGAAGEVALMTYDDAGQLATDAFFVPTVALVGEHVDLQERWYGGPRIVESERGTQTTQIAEPVA